VRFHRLVVARGTDGTVDVERGRGEAAPRSVPQMG